MNCGLCGAPGANKARRTTGRKVEVSPKYYHSDCLQAHAAQLRRARKARLARKWQAAGQGQLEGFTDGI